MGGEVGCGCATLFMFVEWSFRWFVRQSRSQTDPIPLLSRVPAREGNPFKLLRAGAGPLLTPGPFFLFLLSSHASRVQPLQ